MRLHTRFKMKSSEARSGFTLIEILMASAIMVILVGMVLQITTNVLGVWNASSGKLAANAEARIALDLLTQDLETAVFRDNGKQWLRVEGGTVAGGPYAGQTVVLKLFSPALDRVLSVPGDICAIGYELNYGPAYTGSSDKVYALYRKIVDPKITFDELIGSEGDAVQSTLSEAPWTGIVDSDYNNYLVGNVVEFKVLLYEDDGTGVARPVNADSDFDIRTGSYAIGGTAGTVITNPVVYAEVILTVVSDEGSRLLQAIDDNLPGTGYVSDSDGTAAEKVIRDHGEVFSRRVNFPVRPL